MQFLVKPSLSFEKYFSRNGKHLSSLIESIVARRTPHSELKKYHCRESVSPSKYMGAQQSAPSVSPRRLASTDSCCLDANQRKASASMCNTYRERLGHLTALNWLNQSELLNETWRPRKQVAHIHRQLGLQTEVNNSEIHLQQANAKWYAQINAQHFELDKWEKSAVLDLWDSQHTKSNWPFMQITTGHSNPCCQITNWQ